MSCDVDRTPRSVALLYPLGLFVEVFLSFYCRDGCRSHAILMGRLVDLPARLVVSLNDDELGGHDIRSQGVGRGYNFKPSDITGGCLALT